MDARFVRFVCTASLMLGSGCHYIGLRHDNSLSDPTQATLRNETAAEPDDLTVEQSADACIATAEELENNGWEPEAIAVYERALTFEPKRKGVAFRLARLYARTGNVAAAREQFEKAAAETPKDADLYNDFGYFLFEQGDLQSAEAKLRRALELQPDDQRCRTNLALTLAATERFDESLALFEQAVGSAAARSNLAVLLAQAGRIEESRSMLAEARELDPAIRQAEAVQDWMDRSPVDPATEQSTQHAGVAKVL